MSAKSKSLKTLRLERGLSLRDVAKKTGVAYETIRQVELGQRTPLELTRYKLAKFFGIDPEKFQVKRPDR